MDEMKSAEKWKNEMEKHWVHPNTEMMTMNKDPFVVNVFKHPKNPQSEYNLHFLSLVMIL